MDIMDSALGLDIKRILKQSKIKRTYWMAEFHTPVESVQVFKVVSIDIKRDYENDFSDEIILRIVFFPGKYNYRIFPYLDNLELSLYRFDDLGPISNIPDLRKASFNKRYKATIIKPPSSVIENNNSFQLDERSMDLNDIITLDVQLIDKSINEIRLMSIGGVYRNTNTHEVIKNCLTQFSSQVSSSSEDKPKGVDIVPYPQIQTRQHILVRHGTRLVDLPNELQKNAGGVYPAGLGYFYQDNIWYVYPAYDTGRFNTTIKTMTIINVPSKKLPASEKTYIVDGQHTTVIATGNTNVLNMSESLVLNLGNGSRFTDAGKIMNDVVDVSGNRALVSRGSNNNEISNISRDDKINIAYVSDSRITSNVLNEYSKLALRDGVLISVQWENSNLDLIYPGLPVLFKFLHKDKIKEIEGVVLKTSHYIELGPDGMLSNRHATTTNLGIFVKRKLYEQLKS